MALWLLSQPPSLLRNPLSRPEASNASRRVIVTSLDVRENSSLYHCDNLYLCQRITKITSISCFTLNSEFRNIPFSIYFWAKVSLLKAFHISLNSVASIGKYWDAAVTVTVVLDFVIIKQVTDHIISLFMIHELLLSKLLVTTFQEKLILLADSCIDYWGVRYRCVVLLAGSMGRCCGPVWARVECSGDVTMLRWTEWAAREPRPGMS